MKILIVRTSSLGDIIHTLPVAEDIKRALPEAELHWVVEESFQEVCRLSQSIDRIHLTAFRRWRKHLFSMSTWREIASIKRRLQDEHFDCVVDTQGLLRSAIVASWTKSPTIGYSKETLREPLARFFYQKTIPMDVWMGTVPRYRQMAAASLGYSLDGLALRFGVRPISEPVCELPQRFAALFVSTSRADKHWQIDCWRELVVRLKDELHLDVVLFWANDTEHSRAEAVANGFAFAHVLPKMRIVDVAAVVDRSVVGIGVDTGLTHLCAALAKPTVGIWQTTNTQRINLVGETDCLVVGGDRVQVDSESVFEATRKVMGLC